MKRTDGVFMTLTYIMISGLLFFIEKLNIKSLFFQSLFNMSKQITVKYYTESEFAKELQKATEVSAGFDVFAAETKTILPSTTDTLSLEIRWAIPTGFYGKLFVSSGILREEFVTIGAGVIDSDYRGVVKALVINHNINKPFTVRTGDRVAQVVFMERFDINFEKVSHPNLLGKTKCGNDGFGSTGIQVIKKGKKECLSNFLISKVLDDDIDGKEENQIDAIEGEQSTADQNTCKMLTMVDKPNDDLQITYYQITVDNKIIVSESIIIE